MRSPNWWLREVLEWLGILRESKGIDSRESVLNQPVTERDTFKIRGYPISEKGEKGEITTAQTWA